jgi:hypothetical protein
MEKSLHSLYFVQVFCGALGAEERVEEISAFIIKYGACPYILPIEDMNNQELWN